MRLRRPISGLLLLAAIGAGPAATSARAAPSVPLIEQQIAPAAVGGAASGYGWQPDFQSGPVLLRPDATLRSYRNTSNEDNAGPAVVTVFDPFATLTDSPYATAPANAATPVHPSTDIPFLGNLTGLEAGLSGDTYWRSGTSSIGGADWSLEQPTRSYNYAMIARDDRETIVRRVTLKHSGNSRDVAVLATPFGPRGVLSSDSTGDTPGGRIVDARGRTLAELPKSVPKSAAALGDGTILVLGDTRNGRSLARVSPSGHVTYPAVVRPKATQLKQLLQTAGGPYVSMVDTASDWADFSFARISARGVLGHVRKIKDMGIAWPRGCRATKIHRLFDQAIVGPSGTIVFAMDCYPINPDGSYAAMSSVIIELTADLTFKQIVAAASQPASTSAQAFRKFGTLPDGRLFVTHGDGSIGAVAFPDALPVTQGTLRTVTARGTAQAIVRVACKRPYGAICSGRALVRASDGTVIGWAAYALPGRPGKAQAEADITVQRTAAGTTPPTSLPVGATATLLPLPAQFERGGAVPQP